MSDIGEQDYQAWFTAYPSTHRKGGETVEVVPRSLLAGMVSIDALTSDKAVEAGQRAMFSHTAGGPRGAERVLRAAIAAAREEDA